MDIEFCDNARYYSPCSVGGSPMPIRDVWQTDIANTLAYINWRDYFTQMAINSFTWYNLPNGITSRAIETCLTWNGIGGMFDDGTGRLCFCPATIQGQLNMYYEPNEVRFYSPNGNGTWYRRCSGDYVYTDSGFVWQDSDAVVLYDNALRVPLMRYIDVYARRIAKIDRVVDVNINAQMTPWIARASEMGRKDIINKMIQITGNEPVIVENDGMTDDTSLHVQSTVAPFVSDKVLDVQARIMNQMYTILGIDNSFNTKKEREVNSEIESNNEQIMFMRNSRAQMRDEFCKQINEKWDLNVYYTWSVDHDNDGKVDMSSGSMLGVIVDDNDVYGA